MSSERQRKAQNQAHLRSLVAVFLIITWSIMVLTGLLLYIAPTGPRSGRQILFLLTKALGGDVLFWVCLVAILMTVIHVIVDWRALRGCIRYLTSPDRSRTLRE